jgi:hypothetical protein
MQEFKLGQTVIVHSGFNSIENDPYIGVKATVVEIDKSYPHQPCIKIQIDDTYLWVYPRLNRQFDIQILGEDEKVDAHREFAVTGSINLRKAFVAEMMEEGFVISIHTKNTTNNIHDFDKYLISKWLVPSSYNNKAFTATGASNGNKFFLPQDWEKAKEAVRAFFEKSKEKVVDYYLPYKEGTLKLTLNKYGIEFEYRKYSIETLKTLIEKIGNPTKLGTDLGWTVDINSINIGCKSDIKVGDLGKLLQFWKEEFENL